MQARLHVIVRLAMPLSLTVLACGKAVPPVPHTCSVPSFAPAVEYRVADNLSSSYNRVAVADFNRDGKPDLAVAYVGGVTILLGSGNGTFRGGTSYGWHPEAPVLGGLRSLAVADFNGDGNLDIAATNQGVEYISILFGKSDGSFQAAVDYPTASDIGALIAGDFNEDGRADLASGADFVAGSGQDFFFSVRLGNGNGTFRDAQHYGLGREVAPRLASADFNADGRADLAYVGDRDVFVLLNGGNGIFRAPARYGLSQNASAAAVGDTSGDGKPDIVVSTTTNFYDEHFLFIHAMSAVSVLVGNGDGTFAAPVVHEVDSASAAGAVAIGDLNGDGRADLVVARYADAFSVLLGKADGTLEPPFGVTLPKRSYSVTIADFNGDGRPDLAFPNDQDANSLMILLGTCGAT
jgi:hypothetical protein